METNYTLLCVDDDPHITSLVDDHFEQYHADIEVLQENSARAGLERIRREGVDCVVSDYQMPDIDGLEFLEAVRDTHPDLPFILFTGAGTEEVAAEAVRSGATDYISKATGTDQYELLANRVRNAVDSRRTRIAYRELFDAVDDAVLVLDVDAGTVVDANAATCDYWELDRSGVSSLTIDDLGISVPVADEVGVTEWLRTRDEADSTVVDWHCKPDGLEPFWAEVSVRNATIGGRERTLVIARDVTERRRREAATDTLLSTARDLMAMTSREAICETAVETVRDLFDADASRAYLIDPEIASDASPTRPAAATDEVRTAVPDDEIEASLGVDDIIFAEAEGQQYGRRASDDAPGALSVELELPLGDHGLLYVGATDRDGFDRYERDLTRILAAHVGAALDRADRDRLLRDRERELADKRDELAALNHVNEVIRDVNQALVHVSTREDIERLVCERFAAADRYRYAWIGRYSAESNEVTSVARAGIGESDRQTETVSVGSEPNEEALARAIEENEVAVIPEITRSSLPDDWIERARANGYHSVAYVPVTYQNMLYDVLVVYAGARDAFGPDERTVLAELGETIGYAINAAQRRSTQLGSDVVELTFSVRDDSFLVGLSAALECNVELVGRSLQTDGVLYLFVRVQGAAATAVTAWAEDAASVEEIVKLDDCDGGVVFKVGIRESPIVEYFAEQGVRLAAASAAGGHGTVVAETYEGTDLRQITDLLETRFDGAKLVSREVRRDRSSRDDPWSRIADRLTDRQHEVLQVAFHGGFFDQPRRKNGEALADLLGITQPTFHQHLRVGQRELLSGVFEHRE
jgi:PAS domain S-box-containing protein